MPSEIVARVRRTSLVSTFGVGSLLPSEDDSFMIRGLEDWYRGERISEPRLGASLGVSEFRSPATRGRGDVPAVRFPEWQFCTNCRRLGPWWEVTDPRTGRCGACTETVSPSRFVSCCTNGHIEDFPYRAWVHESGAVDYRGHSLTLVSRGHTSALSDLMVTCECGMTRSMAGAFDLTALRGIRRCSGSRPWLDTDDDACDQQLRTLQRGSSNVWFAVTRSAISIPSPRSVVDTFVDQRFDDFDPDTAATDIAAGLRPPAGFSKDDVARAIERRRTPATLEERPSERELRAEEYRALVNGSGPDVGDDQFLCKEIDLLGSGIPEIIAQVSRVGRLREVRALTGFTRVLPLTDESEATTAPLTTGHWPWLPAIEVMGEGVFLRLDESLLSRWATGDFALSRSNLLLSAQRAAGATTRTASLDVSARVLALHSLAHVLVDEMSLTSGYPAASLRERVYDDDGQAGVLIYTATADSAGSLGGLVALSAPERLHGILVNGMNRASWCTTDPVCIESQGSGVNGMNLAACHACLLLPETSCERFNLTLDRATLIGLPGQETLGLFPQMLMS